MTFTHALATNNYGPAKFIVDASAANGTHTTIATALTSASSGDTIFIRPGTYTENLTLKAGVNLVAYSADAFTPNVIILGKASYSGSGTVTISGIQLKTNSDNCIAVTGASSVLNLVNCYINGSNADAISQSNGAIFAYYSTGNLGTTGIKLFALTGGTFATEFCQFNNSGASVTASTCADGALNFTHSNFLFPITVSGTTGAINAFASAFSAGSAIALTQNSTSATEMNVRNCFFFSNTVEGITIGAGAQLTVDNCVVRAHQANAITGAGSVKAAGIVFEDLGTTISTSTVTTLSHFPSLSGGSLIQQTRVTSSTPSSTSATIPSDNTIPQNTEGTALINVSITPTNASSVLVVEAVIPLGNNNAGGLSGLTLFRDSGANAVAVATSFNNQNNGIVSILYTVSAGSTASTNFALRYGALGAGTVFVNQQPTFTLGSVFVSTLTVTEFSS